MEKKINVLIIDDQEDSCTLIHDILEKKGFEAEYRLSAEEGIGYLELHKDYRPGVVLLDINLGKGMSGIDALKFIKNKYDGVEVIMVTGSGTFSMGVECRYNGAFDYLTKPVDVNRLIEKVKAAAERNPPSLKLRKD